MQDESPKTSLVTRLMLQYMADEREKRKKVKQVFASNEQGHHALFTKVKGRGTPKVKRKTAKHSRRINRQR